MEAYWGGPTADKALRKANELDVLFLRNKMPGLQEMKWVTEEDDLVAQDEDFKAVVTSVGIMSTDGAVVRVVVQDGGPDVDSQQIVITSVVIQLDYEELLQKSSPAELQKQKEKMMASRWSILS